MEYITADFEKALKEFKTHHGIHHVIAFSGGADSSLAGVPESDPLQKQYQEVQKTRELRVVKEALSKLRRYKIAVLTGGTKYGFPNSAFQVAKEFGLKTIGVFPLLASQKKQVVEGLDLAFCVLPSVGASAWGDESTVFSKILDAAIVYGGSAGTLVEVAHILKMNESIHKSGGTPKCLAPLQGTGGVADGLHFIWGKQTIKKETLPDEPILTGYQAVSFIESKLELCSVELTFSSEDLKEDSDE